MESEDEEKDSKAATDPTIEGKVHDEEDVDDKEDNDNNNNDKDDDNNDNGDKEDNDDKEDEDEGDDDNEEATHDDNEERIFDLDLNDVKGMSEYELLRLRNVHRNNARLASLGLLVKVMTSAASPFAKCTNRKKHVATQGDFVRRIQPKRIVSRPTSYKDLDDDPVISKRKCFIDSSDTGEEDTGSKRMDKAEYSPSGGDDEEVDDEDELKSYDNKDNGKLDRQFPQAKAEAAVDLVIIDEVEQDHSNLDYQFVEEVFSGSNDMSVLTPPNFNEDAYANKLALYPHHQCVHLSPESIKAIEVRDVFFQDVVNSRNIAHLRGLPTIRHQVPREKTDNLTLCNGSTQNYMYGHYHVKGKDPNDDRYCNPETGEGENQTFKVPFDFVNYALVHRGDSKLAANQIVDCFGDKLNCVPPRSVNGRNFDWEQHVHASMTQDQQEQIETLEIEVLKCQIFNAINVNQTALNVIVYGSVPCKYWPNRFSKAYQLAISYCANNRGCKTSKIMFVVRIVQVRHFSSVYYGVCSDYLLVMQGQIITWLWNLLEGTSSDYILKTYNYANILHQRGESMSKLVSFITSQSIDYKVKTKLNMLSGDEHQHMINYSSKYIDEIFHYVINSEKIIAKPNQPNKLIVSHLHSYISWRGYLKAAEARGDKMGIKWEEKYAEFESYDGMPERESPLYNWQQNQLGNKKASLNAKIWKEKGSTIWSERRVKLVDCVEQKNRAKISNAWEEKYTEFESYDGMPKRGTLLYNWQQSQLSNTHDSCLNAKIQKELAENEGSIWRERRVKLANCVEQKRRE